MSLGELSYYSLGGLASLSFGAHLSRSSMTILLVYLVADGSVTPLGYSLLQGRATRRALLSCSGNASLRKGAAAQHSLKAMGG